MHEHGAVVEYIESLKKSERLGHQVVHHRVLEGREARFGEPVRPLARGIREMLDGFGVQRLYSHQALAADIARSGRNVVVATPTASGKTLTYNVPVLEQVLGNPDSRALYLFPLKALAQDQLKAFNSLTAGMMGAHRPTAAIYDGDTSPYARKKIRQDPPNVLMTNPEMVHLSILPFHASWAAFLSGLTHVVVDEVHTFRGVMGSHMAWVFRRLLRMAAYYGSRPSFVFCSATVGNPGELAHRLTGLEVQEVAESGAAQGRRHFLFLNPMESPATAAIQLLRAALARGLRTIVYAQSRKMTELISLWAVDKAGKYKDRISAYRAGFLPEERREIEARMSSGDLLAVISTSALELGIDIGGLDLCILVGYPGTVMQTMQRGGRVGRSMRTSAVVLVAQEDALDQYFMRNPDDFFSRPAESAVLNPANPVITARHLSCAAAELALNPGESMLTEPGVGEVLREALERGELLESADGSEIYSRLKRPQRHVDLRGAGKSLAIEDADTGEVIGHVDETRACKEAHPGAVYLHRGRSYLVEELDPATATIRARARRVGFYTRVRTEKETEILEVLDSGVFRGIRAGFGKLRVTERVMGYEKRKTSGGTLLTVVPLDLPPLVFETQGLWLEIPAWAQKEVEARYHHFMGAIHALEHAAIGILPLVVMADRNDLGGISTPMHHQVGRASVFVYDGMPGGAGLTREAFSKSLDFMEATLKAIDSCPCELGCPSCVHSPKCGSGNRPMDKDGAGLLLGLLLDENAPEPGEALPFEAPAMMEEEEVGGIGPEEVSITPVPEEDAHQSMEEKQTTHFTVLDIETRRSAQEVGGWHRADRMGVSVAVLYDSRTDEFTDYHEQDVPGLIEVLAGAPLVVGFNIMRFDYKVLSGYTHEKLTGLPTMDLLTHIHSRLGHRLKLDNLAQATLGAGKTADGLKALEWFKQGKMDLIAQYCREDVRVTRDLYLYGLDKGYVLYTNKAGKSVRLPVHW